MRPRAGLSGLHRSLAVAAMLAVASPSFAQGVDVRDLGHFRGSAFAPVQVVELADFGCSACGLFGRDVMPRIVQEYIESGRVGWRMIPIRLNRFRHSERATKAAECAARQDEFWTLEHLLFDRQRDWQQARDPTPILSQLAIEAGVDSAEWQRCYLDRNWRDPVDENNRVARRLRVTGTPTFFVNGQRVLGALPYDQFSAIIEEAEAAAFR